MRLGANVVKQWSRCLFGFLVKQAILHSVVSLAEYVLKKKKVLVKSHEILNVKHTSIDVIASIAFLCVLSCRKREGERYAVKYDLSLLGFYTNSIFLYWPWAKFYT